MARRSISALIIGPIFGLAGTTSAATPAASSAATHVGPTAAVTIL